MCERDGSIAAVLCPFATYNVISDLSLGDSYHRVAGHAIIRRSFSAALSLQCPPRISAFST
jgi:hypothetical protein